MQFRPDEVITKIGQMRMMAPAIKIIYWQKNWVFLFIR